MADQEGKEDSPADPDGESAFGPVATGKVGHVSLGELACRSGSESVVPSLSGRAADVGFRRRNTADKSLVTECTRRERREAGPTWVFHELVGVAMLLCAVVVLVLVLVLVVVSVRLRRSSSASEGGRRDELGSGSHRGCARQGLRLDQALDRVGVR